MRLSCLFAFAATVPVLMAAGHPLRLQPSSPWDVDYADDSCRLIRTFGSGSSATILKLESNAPGEMDMLAVGKPLDSDSDEVPARFLPVGGKTFAGEAARSATKGDPAVLWSKVYLAPDAVVERNEWEDSQRTTYPNLRPPPVDLAEQASERLQRQQFAGKVTELEIQARANRPVILETGSMGDAIAMFDKCTRDSLKDWGVDPNIDDKVVLRPWAASPYSWFKAEDYPPAMVNRGEESIVRVRLLVDASGKVTKCTSLSNFKAEEFNQITCASIMKRARLEPAELADGTKVPSYYTQQIEFRLGE